nr:MAG TPA: hypothetical protein [Caudoviricetes sp.]
MNNLSDFSFSSLYVLIRALKIDSKERRKPHFRLRDFRPLHLFQNNFSFSQVRKIRSLSIPFTKSLLMEKNQILSKHTRVSQFLRVKEDR